MRKLLALFLLAPRLLWGAENFDGSTAWAILGSAEITNEPVTFCAWVNTNSNTTTQIIYDLHDSAAAQNRHSVRVFMSSAGVISAQSSDGAAQSSSSTTGTLSNNTWHHACGVIASITSRTSYLDGTAGTEDTNSRDTNTFNQTTIGVTGGTTQIVPWNGEIAEVGVWNVALTTAEIASLAKGFVPTCIRRASLVSYYPMVRDTTSAKDIVTTATNLTFAGTVAVADHPRVINCQ